MQGVERTVSVYFDTNFWVKLASLDVSDGDAIVEELTSLGVRPVVSDLLLHELLRKATKLDVDRRIASLAGSFPETLDLTGPVGGFRMLLAAASMRTPLAAFQKELHRTTALAESLSLTAERGDAPERGLDVTDHWQRMQQLFGPAGVQVPAFDDFERMDSEAKERLVQQMEQVLPPAVRDHLDLTRRLQEGMTRGDDRVVRVATNEASEKTLRRLSADLRDASHMAVFVQHRNQIDFLQIDGPQSNRLRSQPDHELHVQGLSERCFVAKEPAHAAAALQSLIQARFESRELPRGG